MYLITLAYFALGFINIVLAMTALICIFLPFVIVLIKKRNLWCQSYCPRSSWLQLIGRYGRNRKTQRWIVSNKAGNAVLLYFGLNLFFVTMSSIMVSIGKVPPMDMIRLFIIIPTGWQLSQLINIGTIPPLIIHLSYRFYSVMLSSTILGTLLSLFFKPRTWCAICPIKTLNTKLLKNVS